MRATLILILAIASPCLIHAQQTGKITGTIKDAKDGHPLEGATISVLNNKTGIYINHAVSNKKGEFTVSGVPQQTALDVIVSFTGYADTSAKYTLAGKDKSIATGEWQLKPGGEELDAVTVTARKPPFIVKKDTVEFDATAFKSLPTDMVQDLLRKLPGMVVDEQGNVTVNGKKVSRIKVDGRDFFSGNISTVMQNLPGSIIDKVQVYDTRERGTENNSIIKPITENVTLNLTLKKENKKGVFGNAGAGVGTEDRYNGRAFLNRFNEGRRTSVFGQIGNANTASSFGHGAGGMPIEMMFMGGSGVLRNSTGGGINFNNDFSRKARFDANYFGNGSNSFSETTLERINILPDSSFLYNSASRSDNKNQSHRIAADFNAEIDSLQRISIQPTISFTNQTHDSYTSAASTTTNGGLINTQESHNKNTGRNFSLSNSMHYSRASRDRKTNIAVNWSLNLEQANGRLRNQSKNLFYNNSIIPDDTLDQQGTTRNNALNNNLRLNFSHRIGDQFTTILNYTFTQASGTNNRDVYNFNRFSGKHDELDSLYSSHNRNTGITHLPTASIGYTGKKLAVELGAGLRWINQENRIVWKDSSVKIVQRNFSPRVTTSYEIAKNTRWVNNYSVEAAPPSPDQLAPVQDNTNPLYIRIGNPFLRSMIIHNINTELHFSTRDYKWRTSLRGNSMIFTNQVVNDTYYDSVGRQVTTYRNTGGNSQLSLNLSGGTRIKVGDWNLNIDINANHRNFNTVSFVNRQQNRSSNIQYNPAFNFSVSYKQMLTVHANAAININQVNYSLENVEDLSYNIKNFGLNLHLVPVKFLVFNSSLVYSYNSQLPDNFQRSRTIVNAAINYSFLKSRKLTAGVSVNDLLNDNVNTSRHVTASSIETAQFNALKRYAMINLSYRLSSFGGIRGG